MKRTFTLYRFILPALLLVGGASALSADDRPAKDRSAKDGGYAARAAARDRAELDRQLAGLVPGKPQRCIDSRRYQDSTRIGDKILYRAGHGNVVVTDTGGGCFGLRRGDAIVTRSFSGQWCRGDIVETVDLSSHTHSGSCAFGDFVPYRKP